jgi:hypothetical protein
LHLNFRSPSIFHDLRGPRWLYAPQFTLLEKRTLSGYPQFTFQTKLQSLEKMKGFAGYPEVVEVVVFVKDHRGADQRVNLGGLQQPVRFDDISQRLVDLGEERVASMLRSSLQRDLKGFPKFSSFVSRRVEYDITVSTGSSTCGGIRGEINMFAISLSLVPSAEPLHSDQPLLHFFHDVFLETTNPQPFDSTESIAKAGEDDNIDIGGLVRIAFRKCVAWSSLQFHSKLMVAFLSTGRPMFRVNRLPYERKMYLIESIDAEVRDALPDMGAFNVQ